MAVRRELWEGEVDADPMVQFRYWFDEALAVEAQAEAFALATSSSLGAPSVRMILLRGLDGDGFIFFTNLNSRKGRELEENSQAALVFYWFGLQRQVRAEGKVGPISPAESDAYFRSRPRGHQLSAWASPQSEPIPDREFLASRMRHFEAQFPGEVPRPRFWGGLRLVPQVVEFWQGGDDRLHDRLVYRRSAAAWAIERLGP